MQRIIENHAKLMAIADCLSLVMDIGQHDIAIIQQRAVKMAEERQEFLKKYSPQVELFRENFNFLNSRFEAPSDKLMHQENCINHHPQACRLYFLIIEWLLQR